MKSLKVLRYTFVVIFLSGLVTTVFGKGRKCDCSDEMRKIFKTEEFDKIVYSSAQKYKDAQTNCKVDEQFTYKDFTGTCRNCMLICGTDGNRKECMDKCESYMTYQLSQKQLQLTNDKNKDLQQQILDLKKDLAEQRTYVISLLIAVSVTMGAVLIIVSSIQLGQYIYNKNNYAKLHVANPLSDVHFKKSIPMQPDEPESCDEPESASASTTAFVISNTSSSTSRLGRICC